MGFAMTCLFSGLTLFGIVKNFENPCIALPIDHELNRDCTLSSFKFPTVFDKKTNNWEKRRRNGNKVVFTSKVFHRFQVIRNLLKIVLFNVFVAFNPKLIIHHYLSVRDEPSQTITQHYIFCSRIYFLHLHFSFLRYELYRHSRFSRTQIYALNKMCYTFAWIVFYLFIFSKKCKLLQLKCRYWVDCLIFAYHNVFILTPHKLKHFGHFL